MASSILDHEYFTVEDCFRGIMESDLKLNEADEVPCLKWLKYALINCLGLWDSTKSHVFSGEVNLWGL